MLSLPAHIHGSDDPMCNQLVLSLFSGADLFGRAFQAHGAVVVSAGDILLGRDIRDFHARSGMFDGVIGGPCCQTFSTAGRWAGTEAENLIPEYLRIVEEAQPQWAVMENVAGALPAAPDWPYCFIQDWNCGGFTMRERPFWFYGLPAAPVPAYRAGNPSHSVLASSYKVRTGKPKNGTPGVPPGVHQILQPYEAAYLQGYSGLHEVIMNAQPADVSETGRKCLAIHMLGNGPTAAMANYVAGHVAYYLRHGETFAPVQLPMFAEEISR